MTDNPWPSSDWIAFASERGIVATLCLGAALVLLVWRAIADLRDSRIGIETSENAMYSLALIGTIVATVVVGAFDAVLLIAVPAMFMWLLAGALARPEGFPHRPAQVAERPRAQNSATRCRSPLRCWAAARWRRGRTAARRAMSVTSSSTKLAAIEQGAPLDPGNYRIQMHAAQVLVARHDCAKARPYAHAAHALYPSAAEAKRLQSCEDKRP